MARRRRKEGCTDSGLSISYHSIVRTVHNNIVYMRTYSVLHLCDRELPRSPVPSQPLSIQNYTVECPVSSISSIVSSIASTAAPVDAPLLYEYSIFALYVHSYRTACTPRIAVGYSLFCLRVTYFFLSLGGKVSCWWRRETFSFIGFYGPDHGM